jgi:hypothetical protein
MTLQLDHLLCMVAPDGKAARNLEEAGWLLDAGTVHAGQGTRNRRLAWADCYLELLWIADPREARANPLRLDRRADWVASGASPIGIALRGQLPEDDAEDYWLYDALGLPIWVHSDNDRAPERPLVFVLETPNEALKNRRPSSRAPELLADRRGSLRSARVTAPAPASVPQYEGPPIEQDLGPHHLELVVADGTLQRVTDVLSIRG